MKKLVALMFLVLGTQLGSTQVELPTKFGKGIQAYGKDSTFYMKFGMRFQNLFSNEWAVDNENDGTGELIDYSSNFLIRRARFKFDGYAYTPKLKYKFEMGLSNRDNGGVASEFNNGPKFILDALIQYNFYKNFSIKVGQGKLPGNRERVISSGNLQFVDRSRVNSRFNIDRDFGITLMNHHTISGDFIMKEVFSLSQGEGRNITAGNLGGGFDYTFRAEFLPWGNFKSKGDYSGSDLKREPKPKLAIGVTYDINDNAVRERGQNGSFIFDEVEMTRNYLGKTLQTIFIDAMFKYKGFSLMGEFADKQTSDGDPVVMNELEEEIGTFYTGHGLNLSVGYLMKNNWEIAARYTIINPDEVVANDETEYTVGLSRFIVGHKLKVQTDISYRDVTNSKNKLFWRVQVDLHF
ncbi:MAG: porin [Saprospiraceae bacterium]|jgi:phosphate-selective porin OprO/OprP|nr:porin [Saprospiraceae bacterium]